MSGFWERRYAALPVAAKLRLFPLLTAVALSLVLLVTVAFGLVGERRLVRMGDQFYPMVEASDRVEEAFTDVQRALQNAAATNDAEHLARADSLARAFMAAADAPVITDDGHQHRELRRRFDRYYTVGRAVTTRLMADEGGDSLTAALRDFAVQRRALAAALAEDARHHRGLLRDAFREEQLWQRAAWIVGLALGLAAVLMVAVLSRVATRRLTAPLGEAVRAVDQLATGDLTMRLPDAGPDEVGHLLRAMGRMVASLRGSEEQLRHQATHDALTGLANRTLFRERVARVEADGERGAVAVLYVDLDDFKAVNDGMGHAAGDRLLVLAADRLLSATRGCDTVARLGGDEFAVLLRRVRDEREASVVAERVTRALGAPFAIGGAEVRVGASVGIALGAAVEDADDLLRFADLAMYAAKNAGKRRFAFFEATMYTAALHRVALESDLREALARDELLLHYQPIVELATGRIVGAEALVRWRHPVRGLIPPMEFIPIAESTGLIVPIGRWVLREACAQAARWRAAGTTDFRIAVNVSAWQVQSSELVADVREALAHAGLPASALSLEITESTMLTDTEVTLGRLHELKALGVTLGVDDFGTGYSSLSYLQRFPIDQLKIDKSFVDGLGGAAHDPALTRAIVAIGGALRLPMVAEGVERPEQVEGLLALGCELAQGFHFARPMPASELSARLAPTPERAVA
ncbi:putative bifunctional diguanylate cyclase/phosphodiesterase [Roseisolibacter agri]|uniref:Cyclic di-GMP phosphodiesterase Gmr n=1 Tax=Roseisolibacter agri TaxID=2014610 RepID=A0AA37QED5_9BACT|nr:EAL domain-containing protein [Roseisolibacter agri]GLC24203.1 hypothetical protein rosag_07160 [Roseisolibacter agri]